MIEKVLAQYYLTQTATKYADPKDGRIQNRIKRSRTIDIDMANTIKDQQDILAKLNIHALNPMQEDAVAAIASNYQYRYCLSPTGTGKTLAFLLPAY